MTEISLTADGARAMREAENLCWRMNVAILGAEQLLSGALVVLRASGVAGLPDLDRIHAALKAVTGAGSDALSDTVRWGTGAREALNTVAEQLATAGRADLDARAILRGVIVSGEVTPMFFAELGWSRDALLDLVNAGVSSADPAAG